MARKRFLVRDIAEILQHWQAGRSIRAISKSQHFALCSCTGLEHSLKQHAFFPCQFNGNCFPTHSTEYSRFANILRYNLLSGHYAFRPGALLVASCRSIQTSLRLDYLIAAKSFSIPSITSAVNISGLKGAINFIVIP